MNFPNLPCTITVQCPINPSEDGDKVEKAVKNIFENASIKIQGESLEAALDDIENLSHIYNVIQSRNSQKAYRKQLKRNLQNNSTWFYLNKQAAFVNSVALCEDYDESPLGPIKIILTSKKIDDVIEWFTS